MIIRLTFLRYLLPHLLILASDSEDSFAFDLNYFTINRISHIYIYIYIFFFFQFHSSYLQLHAHSCIILFYLLQKPLHSVNSSELKPLPSVLDITDSSLLNAHPTTAHHAQSLGHSIFLKRSRHYYSHQYSRRNSVNHANASTSRGKAASLRDERLSFKLAAQFNSQTGHHSGAYLFLVLICANSTKVLFILMESQIKE
jgi:hypothetical protein